MPFNFTALKTAVPASRRRRTATNCEGVARRGKYLLLDFGDTSFVIHLMQGGRLLDDTKVSVKPRGGQARFLFEPNDDDGRSSDALLLTEQGKERRAGVWCTSTATMLTHPPLDKLGPEAATITADELADAVRRELDARARLPPRPADGRGHRASTVERDLPPRPHLAVRQHPQARCRRCGARGAGHRSECIAEGLAFERTRDDMSSSKDRPSAVHARTGEPCDVCGDTIRAVEYSGYTVNYCPTCQTDGKVLADNTTSKFLK